MKGLRLIRRLFPETKHNPCFGIDYEIDAFLEELVMVAQRTGMRLFSEGPHALPYPPSPPGRSD
jgi:hypothetical protein